MQKIKNKDIADALGISTAAVSLALNNKPGVSEETRQNVFALANIKASSPHSSKQLLFVIHKRHGEIIIDKPFFSNLIEAIQIEASKSNYTVVVSHYTYDMNLESYIQSLNEQNIDGVVVLATEMLREDLEQYKKLTIPFVLLDSDFDIEPYDAITIDNQSAILCAFEYAYSLGHRNIGYLKSGVYINNFSHRFDGYLKGLRQHGLEFRSCTVFTLHCNIEMAYLQMCEILKQLPHDFELPTCFLSDLDYLAIGAIRALTEYNYRVPEDVSIIGFDDVNACEFITPQLTTMRVNQDDIGRLAVQTLVDRINNPHSYHIHTQVSSDLIIRKSVKNICNV